MIQQSFLILALILCLTDIVPSLVQGNTFRPITNCTCPQDVVTYECTVCDLATAWEGTALGSCSGGEIALTSRDFAAPIQPIICSGGRIAARGISVEDGCFTSQLNITFNATVLQGTSVRCSADNGTHSSEVGRDTLILTTAPYSPPANVHLAEVSPAGLLFAWNHDQTKKCPSLRYNVNQSENCGECLNTTDSTSVNCSDFTVSSSVTLCTFAVQTSICNDGGTLFGIFSDSITVNLTVPAVNPVTTVPHYHIDNGLQSLTILFSEVSPFIIYEDINGTVISYMIYYSDSDTGALCGSKEVNPLSCSDGICSDEFDVSLLSSCRPSTDINVTVSAVTNLGEGPQTIPITEGYRNNLVRVQVISESVSINCAFFNVSRGTPKSCNATITYGDNCEEQIQINGVRDSANDSLLTIRLRSILQGSMSSKICGFRVYATANNTRTVTVDGNLLAVPFMITNSNDPGISGGVIAGVVVAFVILLIIFSSTIVALSLCFLYYKSHRKSVNITPPDIPMDAPKFKLFTVTEECNMIDFAKKNVDKYDPDSGKGYYQFTEASKEYISPKTQVALVSENEKIIRTGPEAREIMGISDKRELMMLPDLSGTQWKYVFIQSTSRIRILPKGSHFMFYGECKNETETQEASTAFTDGDGLTQVDEKYYVLNRVSKECTTLDFGKTIEGVTYKPGLGYGFYDFTKPELISHDKQVILMDQDGNLFYGPGARRAIGIGPEQDYDEAEEIQPKFDRNQWKHVFIQTRSNVRKLLPDTLFLYCNVASTEMIQVLEPFEVITVPKVDEDERKIIKFAKKNIPYYNPKAAYAYYEFTGRNFVVSDRNIMALNNDGELFTGPGVRKLAGVREGHEETEELEAPDLSGTEWKCVYIQGRKAYGRVLEPNTQFLYCEYDYVPEIY